MNQEYIILGDAYAREVSLAFQEVHVGIQDLYGGTTVLTKNPRINNSHSLLLNRCAVLHEKINPIRLLKTSARYALVIPEIINDQLETYLRGGGVYPNIRSRLKWLHQQLEKAINYLHFMRARANFVNALEGCDLAIVTARVECQGADVEAGLFSLRNIQVLVQMISHELKEYIKLQVASE